MGKILIVFVFCCGLAVAANYIGFNAFVNVPDKTDVGLPGMITMNIDPVTGIGTVNIAVSSNLDNWQLLVNSDYVGPYSSAKNHILTSSIVVLLNGISPTAGTIYKQLVNSTNTVASQNAYIGVYNFGTPDSLTLYMKLQNPNAAKITYYTTYVNLKVLTYP